MLKNKISRREVLKTFAGGAAGLAFGPVLIKPARAAGTVTFGVISAFTGAYAFAGPAIEKGVTLALKEHKNEIVGSKIAYVKRDDETKPAVGVRRLTEAIQADNVTYFLGNYSSAVGLAQSEIAKQFKVFQYAAGGTEDFTGKKCSRYTFQWSAHPYTGLKATLDYATKELPNAKRWYTITHDYIFGYALYKYAKYVGERKGINFIGNDYTPLGERSYTQYLTKVIAARPEVLLLLNAGQDAATCTRQLHGFGAKIQIVCPWGIEVDQMRELSPEMREGMILGGNYYHEIQTSVNKEFYKHYVAATGEPPIYASAYGYDSVRTVLMAMEKAKSVKVQDVIVAMEGMKDYEGLLGKTSIDPATHQTVRPYFVLKCKPQSKMTAPDDYADIVFYGSDPQPKELNECAGLGPL